MPISEVSTNVPNRSYVIGSNKDASPQQFSSFECAFASGGDGLSDTEATDLYTAVQDFQTALFRNV